MKRIVAVVLAFLLIATGTVHAAEKRVGRVAAPVVKIGNVGVCVASTEEMRRDHMKMLFHQRDRTVRQGLREPRFSLKNCVECHADRDTGSVLGKEGFCSSCHTYAAVRIDCFECHSALRQAKSAGAQR